jgi:hypothetical protein
MKAARSNMAYPFVTRRQVVERLDLDAEFVMECIGLLHRRYQDRAALVPPAGWMASHIKLGEQLFTKLSSPACMPADVAQGATLAKRYAKQIASVLRDDQIARQPGLGLAAAVFGVRRTDALDHGDDPYAEGADTDGAADPAESVADPKHATPRADATQPAVALASPSEGAARRRPGRPKGSKTKAKSTVVPRTQPMKRRRG